MKLSSMRFKNYVWPHNPRVYEIEYRKDVASHRVPFGLYTLQNMGRQHRVLKGEGEFAGAGAYAEFKNLASVFYDPTPGVLVHPLWDAATAYFVSLRLKQEPAEDYVAYSFEFWECFDGYTGTITPVTAEAPAATETRAETDTDTGTQTQTQTQAGNGSAARVAGAEYYTVVHGDTLAKIAGAYGLSMTGILALNPQIRNPNLIYTGDVIRVK